MLEGIFRKLVMAQQLTLEDGHIEEFGVRMALLPTYTLTKLVEETYEHRGDEAFDLLFRTGKHHGHYIIEEVGKEHSIPKQQFIDETVESANVLGLGKIEKESFSTNPGKIVLRLTDSPFAEAFDRSDILQDLDRPVDNLVLGMVHAIGEDIFENEVTSQETHCEFQGNTFCRLVVKEHPA